jgi:hypothetical protein
MDKPKTRGRIKGVKNKRTQFLLAKSQAATAAPVLNAVEGRKIKLSAFEMIAESLNVMGECLGVFIDYARSISADDPAKTAERLEAYDHALHAAAMLAPYRYPKYATLKIGTDDRDDNVLVDDDVSYDSILADLAEHIKRTGVWPRKMIDMIDTVISAQPSLSKPKPPPPPPPRAPPPPRRESA